MGNIKELDKRNSIENLWANKNREPRGKENGMVDDRHQNNNKKRK